MFSQGGDVYHDHDEEEDTFDDIDLDGYVIGGKKMRNFSSRTRNRQCFNPICKSEMARSDAWPIGLIIQSSSDRAI